jgi:hypothetical protein
MAAILLFTFEYRTQKVSEKWPFEYRTVRYSVGYCMYNNLGYISHLKTGPVFEDKCLFSKCLLLTLCQ